MVDSFEYGRDIAILYGSLRSAERILRKQRPEWVCEFSGDECIVFCQTVYSGIQSAYKGGIERESVDQRMQCALLCDTLVSSDILKKDDLEYFESILDSAPAIDFRLYFALIEHCKWERQSIESLQALPLAVRLAFLANSIQYAAESPHTWYCIMLVLTWTIYVETYRGPLQYEGGSLRAFSSLNVRHNVQKNTPTVSSSREVPLPSECAQHALSEMLTTCMGYILDIPRHQDNSSAPKMELRAVVISALKLVSDFLQCFARPSQYSRESILQWATNVAETTFRNDLYLTRLPEYECDLDALMLTLQSCEGGFLDTLCSFLDSEEVNRLLFADKENHAYCRMDSICVTKQGLGDISCSRTSEDASPFHALGMLSRRLSAVFQCVPPGALLNLSSIQKLKGFSDKHDVQVPAFEVDCDRILDDVVKCLENESLKCSDVLVWVLNEDDVMKHDRVLQGLCNHLILLSHPMCFPRLVDRVLSIKECERLKQLLIQACDAAPVGIQKAMLQYCLADCRNNGAFRTSSFEEQLVERINRISSYAEDEAKALAEFASLCLQDPARVIQELVSLAVTDGCVDIVSKILNVIHPACRHKACLDPEKSILELELEHDFMSQLQRPSKCNSNFVLLIRKLEQSNLLECDVFLKYIMHYIELGGSRNPFPDECFPLETLAAICNKIPEDYKMPILLMIAQLLDNACVHLNALQKQQIVSILETCILDLLTPSGDTTGQLLYLEDMLRHMSDMCQVALGWVLRMAKLEECHLYVTLSEMAEKHPLLQTADQWKATCTTLCSQHEGRTAVEVTLPYFCLWLAGATSDEWEVLSEHIVETVSLGRGGTATTAESVKALVNCVAGCACFFDIANWGHFFSCFAQVVKAWLQKGKLENQELLDIIQELLFVLSVVPENCHQQGVILLLDVTQFLDTKLKDQVTLTIKETLALAEAPEQFAAAVDRLGDGIFRQLSPGPG